MLGLGRLEHFPLTLNRHVMPANAGIHVFCEPQRSKTWMAGTRLRQVATARQASPAKTVVHWWRLRFVAFVFFSSTLRTSVFMRTSLRRRFSCMAPVAK